jgi:pyridoxamine 5'-phosphate oxidase
MTCHRKTHRAQTDESGVETHVDSFANIEDLLAIEGQLYSKPVLHRQPAVPMKLEDVRREYLQSGLRRNDLPATPLALFETWQKQAIDSGLPDPTAMVLATVAENGQPSQRIVLLKHLDQRGFVFYTNYHSRKAREMAVNQQVSLLFPWYMMERQVRVCGRAEKVPAAESLAYFATRPRDSQLAAWASQQSSAIGSRSFLLDQLAQVREKFLQGEVPLPDFWGGYRVVPQEIEFWQGGAGRLHDRFEYRLQSDRSWQLSRLAP